MDSGLMVVHFLLDQGDSFPGFRLLTSGDLLHHDPHQGQQGLLAQPPVALVAGNLLASAPCSACFLSEPGSWAEATE